jgi:flagellar biosynthetic protein FliR
VIYVPETARRRRVIDALLELDYVSWISRYAVVLFRTLGLFLFLPIFSAQIIPLRIRVATASVMALIFLPIAPDLGREMFSPGALVLLGIRELAVGFGLGIAARMIFSGAEAAAQLVSGQSGFSLASMVDPTTGDQSGATNLFISMLLMALFLAADLHHLFILAIQRSYELLPPAVGLPDASYSAELTAVLGMRLFAVAIQLAGPALIISISVDLVMVLVGKSMPQIPILVVGYPFKMIAGLISIGVLAMGLGGAMSWAGRTLASDGAMVLSAFGGK